MSAATDEGGASRAPGAQPRDSDAAAHEPHDGVGAQTDPRREIASVDPDDRRQPIEEFGPYLVYELLGQGGMATVHLAEKRGVGIRRPIALKRLLPHGADDPELVKLFVDEARLASYLHHANVAQIYELGKVDETYFIAMEYASGPTLTQIVRQCQKAAGPIPIAITVNLLTQVCDALDYAHNCCDEAGRPLRIIHRDVSPGNIVVTNAGVVKLIDFGIAKATISSVQTQIGYIKGKFGYIAPEYIIGKIDSRADLFATGVIAHELLAGRRLFEGNDDFETLSNIRQMPIRPPSSWNRHVTPDLDDIVMTALARNPAKRWQTAGAMRVALTNLSRSLGVVVGPAQVVEWVQWAFSQVPREPPSGPRRSDAGASDTDLHGAGASHDNSLSIQLNLAASEIHAARRAARAERVDGDAFATPPEPFRPTSGSDADATVPLERMQLDPEPVSEPVAPARAKRASDGVRPEPAGPPPPPPRTRAEPPPPPQPRSRLEPVVPAHEPWPSHAADDTDSAATPAPVRRTRPEAPREPWPPPGQAPARAEQAPLWLSPDEAAVALPSSEPDPAATAGAGARPPLWLPADEAVIALRPSAGEPDPGATAIAGAQPLWPSPADSVPAVPPAHEPWPSHGAPAADPALAALTGPEPPLWLSPSDPGVPAATAEPPLWLSPSDAAVAVPVVPPAHEPWPSHGEADAGATAIAGAKPAWTAAAGDAAEPPRPGHEPWPSHADTPAAAAPPAEPAAWQRADAAPQPSETLRAIVPPVPALRSPEPTGEAAAALHASSSSEPPLPGEPAQPARVRSSAAAVQPTAKVRARPRLDEAVRPIAPSSQRRGLWLALLMVALGVAAMAVAYFWPSAL